MADIKTKNRELGTIKTLDKALIYTQRMKDNIVNAKEKTEGLYAKKPDENETVYATNKISNSIKSGTETGIRKLDKYGKESAKNIKENIDRTKGAINEFKENIAQKKLSSTAKSNSYKPTDTIKPLSNKPKVSSRRAVKNTINTSKKAIKTSENTMRNAERVAKVSAKKAQKTAKMIRESAKAMSKTAKRSIKAMIKAIKAIISVFKTILSLLLGFGWIVVMVVIVICIIGLLVASVFGIFFANEDTGGGPMTMSAVISELNQEFIDKITTIQNENPCNEYDIQSNRADWKDILAVYSVKVNGGNNATEVVTLDEGKVNLLKEIFWEMNGITFSKDERSHEQLQIGLTSTEVVTITEVTLHIQVNTKTPQEMADKYNFNEEQRKQLEELLKVEYSDMWSGVIYGSSIGSHSIVNTAEKEIGNIGGRKFWSWYGFNSRVEWCACFVSWCADQCGYIDAGIIPKFSVCETEGVAWFKTCNLWKERGYTPNPGDIIFFDWKDKETGVRDGKANHVRNSRKS